MSDNHSDRASRNSKKGIIPLSIAAVSMPFAVGFLYGLYTKVIPPEMFVKYGESFASRLELFAKLQIA